MTPLPDSIARSWQLIALSHEVRAKPVPRTVANTPVTAQRISSTSSASGNRQW